MARMCNVTVIGECSIFQQQPAYPRMCFHMHGRKCVNEEFLWLMFVYVCVCRDDQSRGSASSIDEVIHLRSNRVSPCAMPSRLQHLGRPLPVSSHCMCLGGHVSDTDGGAITLVSWQELLTLSLERASPSCPAVVRLPETQLLTATKA